MPSIIKSIHGALSKISESVEIDALQFNQSQVTALSTVGWEGAGNFKQLNFQHTRQITQSGNTVDGKIAASLSAYWACVQMIASDIAKLPLDVFEFDQRGNKVKRNNHPLYKIIAITPDGQITAQEFWETIFLWTLIWGNGYALIGPRDPFNGQIGILELLNPNLVNVKDNGNSEHGIPRGVRYYEIFESLDDLRALKDSRIVLQEDMFHIHGLGDRFSGWPIANFAKEVLGITLSLQELQASAFANGLDLGGFLTTDQTLKPDHRENMAEEWTRKYAGAANRRKVAVLDKSTSYQPFESNLVNAEVLATRKFQLQEVARFFRVPPHKLGISDAMTFDNVEQENIHYITETLSPWIKRAQNVMRFRLFADGSRFFPQFDDKELRLADLETRQKFAQSAIEMGYMTPNMAAISFGLPTYPGGDVYYIAANNLQPIASANIQLELKTEELKQLKAGPVDAADDEDKQSETVTGGNPESLRDDPPENSSIIEVEQLELPEVPYKGDIFQLRNFIASSLMQCVNREVKHEEQRDKTKLKQGADFDAKRDLETNQRFYVSQKAFYKERLEVFFIELNMDEPKGFIDRWAAWQMGEKWAEQKAFLIGNDLIKYYCNIQDWEDGKYEYQDGLVCLENGVLHAIN